MLCGYNYLQISNLCCNFVGENSPKVAKKLYCFLSVKAYTCGNGLLINVLYIRHNRRATKMQQKSQKTEFRRLQGADREICTTAVYHQGRGREIRDRHL